MTPESEKTPTPPRRRRRQPPEPEPTYEVDEAAPVDEAELPGEEAFAEDEAEAYEEWEEADYYEAPADESLLRNPYVLAGLAVAVAIFLAAVVVIVFGGSGGGNGDSGLIISPLTPESRGFAAKSIATATVRDGPGTEYAGIGTLRSGLDVEVVGRDEEAGWFKIYFPIGSALSGWVPNSALGVPDESLAQIPVVAVTPIPRPTVPQATLPPEATATETPTPTATGAAGAIDLALRVLNNNCRVGADLIVVVTNAGQAKIEARVAVITVATSAGIKATKQQAIALDPGASINVPTDVEIEAPRTSAKLDLLGTPPEGNLNNNTADCVAGGPTAVPPPIGTPTPDD